MEIKYFGDFKVYLKGKKENIWINPEKNDLENKERPARIVIFTVRGENFIKLEEAGERIVIVGTGGI